MNILPIDNKYNQPNYLYNFKSKSVLKQGIKESFMSGKTLQTIAEEKNVTVEFVTKVLKSFRIAPAFTFASERKLRVMEKNSSGVSLEQISNEEGLKLSTLNTIARSVKSGVYFNIIERIKNLFNKGMSIEEIFNETKLLPKTIQKLLDYKLDYKKLNSPNNSNNLVKPVEYESISERNEKILELLKDGCPREVVAESMGITSDYVKLIANKLGFNCKSGAKTLHMLNIEERNRRLTQLLKQGLAVSDVAKTVGVSEEMVRQFANGLELEGDLSGVVRARRKKTTPVHNLVFNSIIERDEHIVKLLKQGVPREIVAEQMDLSLVSIRHIARKYGFNCKEGAVTSKMLRVSERDQRILQMKKEGYSNPEIAKKEGISTMTVLRILDKIQKNSV